MLLEEAEHCEGIEGILTRMKGRERLEKILVLMGWPELASWGMALLSRYLKAVMG